MYIDLLLIGFKALSSSSFTRPAPPSSSSSSSNLNFPVLATNNTGVGPSSNSFAASPCSSSHDGREDKRGSGSSTYSFVFGSVPSQFEVESAMAALQSLMQLISSSGPAFSLFQQLFNGRDVRALISHGYGRLIDAFHLLQTDPSVKRLVVSLAYDKAVWSAIMDNEVVRKLRASYRSDGIEKPQKSNEEPDCAMQFLLWIMETIKAKIADLIEKFHALTGDVLHAIDKEPNPEIRETLLEKVRSSLLVTIVIMLIIVFDRIQRA
ncbi:hypothetical protein HS088_TW17G00432 [Tripterygium wilfordii]|uniref:Uncharacterized protein n=1 Tax=Tripterygium wilfordii TaxID=458696 RepID=A0A7J7CFI7_TRIWF|nr:uncharacterized protein LOC119982881 isoform X2 [Tripterygium wilfordii]KAF5732899.1 hypothetical protein HS088_TW17G00432 [Tripterygium wilfordii]